MSAGIGGALIGALVIAALAPLIIKAVCVLLIGGAVIGGAYVAVKAAQLINSTARRAHEKRIARSIEQQRNSAPAPDLRGETAAVSANRPDPGKPVIRLVNKGGRQPAVSAASDAMRETFARRLARQREDMLKMYQRESDRIDALANRQNELRQAMLDETKKVDDKRQALIEDLRRQSAELDRQVVEETNNTIIHLHQETENQVSEWHRSVTTLLKTRSDGFNDRLARIENQIEKNETCLEYARSLIDEAEELRTHLARETDAGALIPGDMKALDQLSKDCADLMERKQGQAAIASAVSMMQLTMEAWVKLDMARHSRQLIVEQLNLSAASLRAMVENGASLRLEGVEKPPKLPTETDYWADGAFAPLMDEARALLKKVDAAAADPSKLSAADEERLLKEINDATGRMNLALQKARARYVCALTRMQLVKKARDGFKASGWTALSWGFEGKDYRNPIVMRFKNEAGALADLVLSPKYDPQTGLYDVEVEVDRHDSGMIDENARDAQIAQLEKKLRENGVPVDGMHCIKSTRGQNSPAPLNNNRFAVPETRNAGGN